MQRHKSGVGGEGLSLSGQIASATRNQIEHCPPAAAGKGAIGQRAVHEADIPANCLVFPYARRAGALRSTHIDVAQRLKGTQVASR